MDQAQTRPFPRRRFCDRFLRMPNRCAGLWASCPGVGVGQVLIPVRRSALRHAEREHPRGGGDFSPATAGREAPSAFGILPKALIFLVPLDEDFHDGASAADDLRLDAAVRRVGISPDKSDGGEACRAASAQGARRAAGDLQCRLPMGRGGRGIATPVDLECEGGVFRRLDCPRHKRGLKLPECFRGRVPCHDFL